MTGVTKALLHPQRDVPRTALRAAATIGSCELIHTAWALSA